MAGQAVVPRRRWVNNISQEESQLMSSDTNKANGQYAMRPPGMDRRFAKSASGVNVSMKIIRTEKTKRMFKGRK
jgi:hypothetical protein